MGEHKGDLLQPVATPYPRGAHWKWSLFLFAQGPFSCRLLEVTAGPKIAGRWEGVVGDRASEASLTFDVSMQNPLGVEVFQSLQGLAQVVEGTVLGQTALLLYELAQ